jgi:3-hydroxy-9,10-secoandrosta-1,3,5(10)-triene-9,17-dione monooxygenase reductase component
MNDAVSFDTRHFRDALSRYATGVALVTALDRAGEPIGMTINSFASVSLTPPLVLWSLDRRSPRFEDWMACEHYAISVLAEAQVNLSNHFATPADDKFNGLDWLPGVGGAPLLPEMHAVFQCCSEARHEGGDHVIFIGRVLEFSERTAEPLLFVGGRYAGVRELEV